MLRGLIARIGKDRALSPGELAGDGSPFLAATWRVYHEQFGAFTGSRLDPQFARLDHPARFTASPRVAPGTTIVIAGAGPSLAARAAELKRLRKRLSIWTSLRGAEALAMHGLDADLIIVQHQSDLDAHLTVRHLRDRNGISPLTTAAVVVAEPKTSADLLRTVRPERVVTFDPSYGWGLWPASLAWMACGAGASGIALAGVDLGTTERVDALHTPLSSLLTLIAEGSPVATVDVGDGAIKRGWDKHRLDAAVGATGSPVVSVDCSPWLLPDERRASLEAALTGMRDYIEAAAMFRSRALECRRAGARGEDGPMAEALSILLSWGESESVRIAFQESLGVTFLPVFWRHAEHRAGAPFWRPVMLAADEIVRQAEAAMMRISTASKATS